MSDPAREAAWRSAWRVAHATDSTSQMAAGPRAFDAAIGDHIGASIGALQDLALRTTTVSWRMQNVAVGLSPNHHPTSLGAVRSAAIVSSLRRET